MSDGVETAYSESKTKYSKLFKSKVRHGKHFGKCFWSYLRVKHECSAPLKIFSWESVKSYLNHNFIKGSFLENGFEATLSSKTSVLSVWKGFFQCCANFWVIKLKPFFGKVRQSVQNYLNENLVRGSFLDSNFGANLGSKQMLWAFGKGIFKFFANFWVAKLKPFSGKVRQSIQNYLNQNLVIGSFSENGFAAILIPKTNAVRVWSGHVSVSCKFFSDQVETVDLEGEAKHSKLFKSKFSHKSFLENGFEATMSSETNVLGVLKEHFSDFCKFLPFENVFWESEAKRSKLGHRKLLKKMILQLPRAQNPNVLSVWKKHFSDFCKFLGSKVENIFRECEANGP